jgi:hypothetical protein
MSHPNAAQGPLPILVALALWGLFVLVVLAWWTFRVGIDRERARSAVSLILFSVAAFCGVLLFGEGFGIVSLTRGPDDRAWLGLSMLVFILMGALVARAQVRRSQPRRRHGQ